MKDQIRRNASSPSSAVYGMGLIGSLIYFIHTATSFGMGALGVLKAIVWPAIMTYRLFEFLKL